jgi:hypothetical protein
MRQVAEVARSCGVLALFAALAGCGATSGATGTDPANGDAEVPSDALAADADAPVTDVAVADLVSFDVALDADTADVTLPDVGPTCVVAACPGDACRAAVCVEGKCALGPVKDCNDSNLCTADFCDSVLGCQHASAGEACDDGDACTTGDACKAGVCKASGTLGCDDSLLCTADSCDPKNGCVHANNSVPCDDGNACTLVDACVDGACSPVLLATCADGNPCTDDGCDPASGCVFLPNSATCNDNNACTQGDTCANGVCKPSAPSPCDDGNPCTSEACDAHGGCSSGDNTAPCQDGSVCTQNDACAGGACIPGSALACADGNPCTDDGCDALTGCTHAANSAECTDQSVCTLGDTCQNGACLPGAATTCDDGNACTTDSCSPTAGCQTTANQLACSDSNVCSGGDACQNGSCIAGAGIYCSDGNPCTDDGCDAVKGCMFNANSAPCDDKNGCTSGDICKDAVCSPGAIGCSNAGICAPVTVGVQCFCNGGYAGDGFTCKDVDECLATPGVCWANSTCINTIGAFGCQCNAPWADCNGATSDGCEADTQGDTAHCGKCGAACSGSGVLESMCSKGECGGNCAAGYTDCDGDLRTNGCETHTGADSVNCGQCGLACSNTHIASQACTASLCSGQCEDGFLDCNMDKLSDGCEQDVFNDVNNCGSCGKACANLPHSTVGCSAGKCAYQCDAGYGDCNQNMSDGCEVNTGTDAENCSTCGFVCSTAKNAVPTCGAAKCGWTCNSGYLDCDGVSSNGCETNVANANDHCGFCGKVCAVGQNCVSSLCQ